ncbi:right-handed parallel beta-helix repeat-containing protein [Streptomyces enissocaesilis]|uniref:Right handed beta helix domain-containing protein n=1 Tax=Streptomyces enissocaesilis TaxID=332589 RepID=A0ABN3XN21_9ACTN
MALYTFGGTPADVLTTATGDVVPDYPLRVRVAGTGQLVTALYEADGTTPIAELRTNPSTSSQPGAVRPFKTDVPAIEFEYLAADGTPLRWYSSGREIAQEALAASRDSLSRSSGGTVEGPVTAAAGLDVAGGLGVAGGATVDELAVQGHLSVGGTFIPASFDLAGMRVFNPRVMGAVADGTTNDAPALQAALSAARTAGGGQVLVPPGTYAVGATLRIYRNTRLTLMPGAVLRRTAPGTMLLNGDADQTFGGYTGHGNIVIEGGVWDMRGTTAGLTASAMCISIGHARGITIRDVEILDVPGYHAIELNSTAQALVENCQFRGYVDPGGRTFSEAVQIDLAKASSVFGGFGPYDQTACEDITVRGCYIGPSGTAGTIAWPRGVGSHAATIDRWHKRIRIIGCTVADGAQFAVGAYAWQDCHIEGNSITGQGAGVHVWTNNESDTNATTNAAGVQTGASQETRGTVIVGNTMRNLGGYDDAITVIGEPTGKMTSVVITGNSIDISTGDGSQGGIRLEHAEQLTVTGNTVRSVAGTGISLVNAVGGAVTGNRILSPGGSGIACAPCTGMQITGNTIREPASHGVHVQGGSDVQIASNYIKGASRNSGNFGIRVTTSADSILITDNKIRRLGSGAEAAYGLSITSSCTNIRRHGNDLANSGSSGPLDDQSTAPAISPLDAGLATYTATVTGGGTATFTTRGGDYVRLGTGLVWVCVHIEVAAAGSGTSTVGITMPTTVARGRQQLIPMTCDSVKVAAQSTAGYAVALTTGTGDTVDRLRTQAAATGTTTTDNRVLNVTGADLLAGAVITIQGIYREA